MKASTYALGGVTFALYLVALAILHAIWPQTYVGPTLWLLIGAASPLLPLFFKNIELSGTSAKVEFQQLFDGFDKVLKPRTGGVRAASGATVPATIATEVLVRQAEELGLNDSDPNIAFLKIRAEIERQLRRIAMNHNVDVGATRTVAYILKDLENQHVLPEGTSEGLRDLIKIGNQVAHGSELPPGSSTYLADMGPRVLTILNSIT